MLPQCISFSLGKAHTEKRLSLSYILSSGLQPTPSLIFWEFAYFLHHLSSTSFSTTSNFLFVITIVYCQNHRYSCLNPPISPRE